MTGTARALARAAREKTTKEVVQAFALTARPIILQYFPPACCVASSRITVECLHRFGIRAEATQVKFVVRHKDFMYVSGLDEEERERGRREAKNWVDKPADDLSAPWHGHVVVITTKMPCCLIDPSFDQVTLPGVRIPPYILAAPLGKAVRPSEFGADLKMVTEDGHTLEVRYLPSADRSFLDAPAWELDHLLPIIDEICGAMKRELH